MKKKGVSGLEKLSRCEAFATHPNETPPKIMERITETKLKKQGMVTMNS